MIVVEAVEGAVHTVGEVVLVFNSAVTVLDTALGVDVEAKLVATSTEEAAGFGDDFGGFEGEEFVENRADGGGEFFEGEFTSSIGVSSDGSRISTSPATTEVEESHLEAEFLFTEVEEITGITKGDVVGTRIGVARTNVEGDTNNVDTDFLGEGHQILGFVAGTTKLGGELADSGAIISLDAEDSFGVGHVLLDLEEFVLVVEGDSGNTEGFSLLHVVGLLARIGKDDLTTSSRVLGNFAFSGTSSVVNDVGAGIAGIEDLLDFRERGTIEGTTESSDHGGDGFRVVALDGVVNIDTRKILLELGILGDDLAQVNNEEGLRGIRHHLSISELALGIRSLFDEGLRSAAAEVFDGFGGVAGHFSGFVVTEDGSDTSSHFGVGSEHVEGILVFVRERSTSLSVELGLELEGSESSFTLLGRRFIIIKIFI